MSDLTEQICALVAATIHKPMVPAHDVAPDSYLRADLGADSLDLHDLSCTLDEAFDILISDEAMSRWQRVQDVADTVRELAGERVDG